MFFLDPAFLKAAAERALKSAAQAVLLTIGADQLDAFNADWQGFVSVAVGAAVLSLLTSIGSGFVGERETPSVAGETLTHPRAPYTPGPDELAVDDDRPAPDAGA